MDAVIRKALVSDAVQLGKPITELLYTIFGEIKWK